MVSRRSSQEPVRVLIVDDDPASRRLAAAAIHSTAKVEADIRETTNLADAVAALREGSVAAAVISLDLGSGPETVSALRRAGLAGPVIATSALGSVAAAVEAMRAGADDFMVKPFQPAELARRLLARIGRSAAGPCAPTDRKCEPDGFEGFIGASLAMRSLYDRIARVAPSRAPVFVSGESGTGKEVCAEAIHARSGRSHEPFIAINCSAIPKELMESEIFGHVKGAFTGAHDDRTGAAELAHGGTLFLDEICEMELALQAKLLRFVQTGTVRRVGETRLRNVDVRFVCATNREPMREIEAGRFREDLYYRLHVLPLHLPPLREREEDVMLLARAFLKRFSEEERRGFRNFSPDVERVFKAHSWPGNVRELQNVIRCVVVLQDGVFVTAEMLALPEAQSAAATHEPARDSDPLPGMASPSIDPYWRQEQRIIEAALAAFGGNTQRAASALEIAPSTIYRKRQAWTQTRGAA